MRGSKIDTVIGVLNKIIWAIPIQEPEHPHKHEDDYLYGRLTLDELADKLAGETTDYLVTVGEPKTLYIDWDRREQLFCVMVDEEPVITE